MKNRLRVLVLFVLLSFVIISSAMAKEINIWLVATSERARIIKDLTDNHWTPKTGVEATFSTMTWEDAMSRIYLAMASGDTPDIAQMGSTWQGEFGLRGGILDLAKAYPEEVAEIMSRMYPGTVTPIIFRGTTWGVPASLGNMTTYVRDDIFTENGWAVPDTWEELYTLLPKMQAKEMNYGIHYGADSISWFVTSAFLRQAGGDVYESGGEHSTLDTPESIDGFIRFVELFTKHGVPKAIQQVEDFRRGDIPLLTISTTVVYGTYLYAAPELNGKWSTALMPGTIREDGTINHSGYLGTNNYAIFERSENKRAAFEWIQWFTSAEIQTIFSKEYQQRVSGAFHLSPNVEAMANMAIPDAHRQVLMKQLSEDIGIPFALGGETVWRYVENATARVIFNNEDPEKSIRFAAKEVTDEMQRKAKEFERFLKMLPES
ncbi:MAG: extracellular solute-binding protein [Firmicutes bacterium]|nr:extracellular solute-binding protein [Bacillota bacterium]